MSVRASPSECVLLITRTLEGGSVTGDILAPVSC